MSESVRVSRTNVIDKTKFLLRKQSKSNRWYSFCHCWERTISQVAVSIQHPETKKIKNKETNNISPIDSMNRVRTLYNPLNHIWLRAKEPLQNKATRRRILEIGLTERGLEDIGDVTSLQQPNASFKRGDELLRINFDGHSITSADELYHTVWETFSDQLSIVAPVSGKATETESSLESLEEDGFDQDTVLVGIETTKEEWEEICQQTKFVDRSEYNQIIQGQPRGAFYE